MKKTNSKKQDQAAKKRVGVWMDHHQAFLICQDGASKKNLFALHNSIETTEPEHERQSEHTIHNAEQHRRLKHFRSIASQLEGFDEILLFGPGTAQEELRNQLSDDVHFRDKRVAVESAGHITQNQMVAKVREYFEANPKAA